jgi:hypothetical protein
MSYEARRLRVPLDGRVGLVFVPGEEKGAAADQDYWQQRSAAARTASACSHPSHPRMRSVPCRAGPTCASRPCTITRRVSAPRFAFQTTPGLLSISHGPKEFVDTRRIVECAAIYARVAATVLKA